MGHNSSYTLWPIWIHMRSFLGSQHCYLISASPGERLAGEASISKRDKGSRMRALLYLIMIDLIKSQANITVDCCKSDCQWWHRRCYVAPLLLRTMLRVLGPRGGFTWKTPQRSGVKISHVIISVFEIIGKSNYQGQKRTQRLRCAILWQNVTLFFQYFWISENVYKKRFKCNLPNMLWISNERARKARKC